MTRLLKINLFLVSACLMGCIHNVSAADTALPLLLQKAGIAIAQAHLRYDPVSETTLSVDLPQSSTIFIKSTELNLIGLSNLHRYDTIVVACDAQIIVHNITCNTSTINGSLDKQIVFSHTPSRSYTIDKTKIDNVQIILVPYQYLVSAQLSGELKKLFQEADWNQTTYSRYLRQNNQPVELTPKVGVAKQTLSTEYSKYATSILLLIALMPSILWCARFVKARGFTKLGITDLLLHMETAYYKYRKYIVFFLLLLILLLILFTITLSLLDKSANLAYFTSKIPSLFIGRDQLSTFTELQKLGMFGTVFILLCILLLLFGLIIPLSARQFKSLSLTLIGAPVSETTYRLLLPILFLVLIYGLVPLGKSPSVLYQLLYCTLLTTMFVLIVKAHYSQIPLEKLYTSGNKLLLFILFSASAVFTYSLSVRKVALKPAYEDLINAHNNIVTLPYFKDFQANAVFKPYTVSSKVPIYIDSVKVSDPKYKKIVNKPLRDFNDTAPWEVVFLTTKDFPESFIKNRHIINTLLTDMPGKYLFIEKSDYTDSFGVRLKFDCTSVTNSDEIDASYFYKKLSSHTSPLMYFPGCTALDVLNGYVTYDIPLFLNSDPYRIIRLDNTEKLPINDIQVLKNDKEVKNVFIKYPERSPIAVRSEENSQGDTLHVYSSELFSQTIQNRTTNVVDLGKIANQLVHGKVVKSPFIIWSNNSFELLRFKSQPDYFQNR